MSLQANSIKDGWTLVSLKKSQVLKAAHAIRKQAAKIYKCKVTEILLAVCLDMARKGEKLKPQVVEVRVSGNTFAKKNYLRDNLSLRWDAAAKEWFGKVKADEIDTLRRVFKLIVRVDGEQPQSKELPVVKQQASKVVPGVTVPCKKCGTYCYGDCEAD